jgi:hypothetical protein
VWLNGTVNNSSISKTTVVTTLPFKNDKGEITERVQFSLAEAHQLTGTPVSTLRKMGRNGIYNPITGFGRKWYISAEDLLHLFNHRLRNQTGGEAQ